MHKFFISKFSALQLGMAHANTSTFLRSPNSLAVYWSVKIDAEVEHVHSSVR